MSVRSFIVFQDSPSNPPQSRDNTPPATDPAATSLSTLAAVEKENLHPVTGRRAGPPMGSEAKKRKTSALATKLVVAPSAKKHKDLKGEQKSRNPPGSTPKPRSADARKNTSKSTRSSRRPSPLPPVAEEHESQRRPACLSVSQIDIDSRCYELTVSPLADVSEAYDATRGGSQEPDVHTETEKSAEPAIHDHFSPFMDDKPLQSMNDASCNTDGQTDEFSTPERKRACSTFTFSSPSPTSERFKQAQSSPTSRDSLASHSG